MRNVTAAVIRQKDQILICKRPEDKQLGGLWEFPGGKQEEGESLEDCLRREIQEELNMSVQIVEPLGSVDNGEFRIHFYLCQLNGEKPQALEHEEIRFVTRSQLNAHEFCSLDAQILKEYSDRIFRKEKRLFIALPLPTDVKDALLQSMADWQKLGIKGRWTRENNLHITLVFIGKTLMEKQIGEVLDQIQVPEFEISFSKAGHFKNLWYAGCEQNLPLLNYAAALKQALIEKGIHVDPKPLKLHITLLRNGSVPEDINPTEQLQIPHLSWKAKEAVLYESSFTSQGVVYSAVKIKNFLQNA